MSSALSLGSLIIIAHASASATQAPPQTAAATASPSAGAFGPTLIVEAPHVSEADAVVPILPSDPVWGSREALVSMVVFGDFQCPFTGKVAPEIVQLEDKYGPRDLRVVWKDLPLEFHPNATPAAEAAQAVLMLGRSDAFWKFWASAMNHQSELNEASFVSWAQGAGVDVASFQRLIHSHAGAPKVVRSAREGKLEPPSDRGGR
jgi:protein-disulfide isomerase